MATLYTSALSANGRKVLALARHLEIGLSVIDVNVYRGEGNSEDYLDLNPWGKIPTLVDQEIRLWESNAIMVYLSEHYASHRLFSKNSSQRANILRWMFWESAHWQPLISRVLRKRVAQVLLAGNEKPAETTDWNDAELVNAISTLQQYFSKHKYICGDELSLADFSLAAMTTYFSACRFPQQRFPEFSTWLSRIEQLPAWQTSLPAIWK